ncbi:low molecular weight phosphatase family protein [Herbiconiux sp. UC225_62]|uniref:arsenate reductase/protein-tyrosine-phosphatase family protein n=1 Tax=Herbiconiux sp. UC225_62 TaxID=3350168 RepID=UPI0036D2AA40
MYSILTVCSGNICRSPMAEQLLRRRLQDYPGIVMSSAGTFAGPNEAMPEEAAALSVRFGGEPRGHLSRSLTESMVNEADLILAMSRNHRREIAELAPRKVKSTFTIREFARLGATLSDEEVVDAARQQITLRSALIEASALVASRRGRPDTLEFVPAEEDVIDPYRRSAATYERSAQELVPAVDEVARILGLAASTVSKNTRA